MLRWIRNLIEDLLYPRPGFTIQVGRRKLEGRVLNLGELRDLTASGAFGVMADVLAMVKGEKPAPIEEQVKALERVITLAAVGLRRSRGWVARHCTSEEAALVVAQLVKACAPPAKQEGPGGPPA